MCGRYGMWMQRPQIRVSLGDLHLNIEEWIGEDGFMPRYNIAPNTQAPVLQRKDVELSNPESHTPGPLILRTMRWGIKYGKDSNSGGQAINARSENVTEGMGLWNKFRSKNRCIVVCQGYYEWQTKGKSKLPHFTKHSDGKIMLMAGLFDCQKKDGIESYTFAIITAPASKSMSWLHDRQPVILSSVDDIMQWLDTSSRTWSPELAKLLSSWQVTQGLLQCYQVPQEVGKVGTESPKFVEPIEFRKDGIRAMFAKQHSKDPTRKRKRSLSASGDLVSENTRAQEKLEND